MLISLFDSYGIQLTGNKKLKNFYTQLHMEEPFVYGLIVEVEYLLKLTIEENWKEIKRPIDLILKTI